MSTDNWRAAKLAELVAIEGLESGEELLRLAVVDVTSPGICMNIGCRYTCEVESDQEHGWCEECSTRSVMAGARLGGWL